VRFLGSQEGRGINPKARTRYWWRFQASNILHVGFGRGVHFSMFASFWYFDVCVGLSTAVTYWNMWHCSHACNHVALFSPPTWWCYNPENALHVISRNSWTNAAGLDQLHMDNEHKSSWLVLHRIIQAYFETESSVPYEILSRLIVHSLAVHAVPLNITVSWGANRSPFYRIRCLIVFTEFRT
jgi:hypothetical protein